MNKIEKLDTIRGFQPFPEGSIYDTRELAMKLNEVIDAMNKLEEIVKILENSLTHTKE